MDWLFPACIISGILALLAIPGILLAYGEAFGNPFSRPSQPPKPHANRCPVADEWHPPVPETLWGEPQDDSITKGA